MVVYRIVHVFSSPPADAPYWRFYAELAAAQLAAWAPTAPARILDLSFPDERVSAQLRDAGHEVLRPGCGRALPGVLTVVADPTSLGWLAADAVDAVVAEFRALSTCLATEEVVRDIARVLRPGGRVLVSVDSLLTGLARLADQGRWAELADVPSSDCVLVPDEQGVLSRCFWPDELRQLLTAAGLVVDWVRPRSVLTPAAVERALEQGGGGLRALVRTELALSRDREGESAGLHLVASAHRPC